MENPGYVALSRQMVLKRQMDVVANNLANVTTPGFRAESMVFVEHLDRLRHSGPRDKVSFVQDIATVHDLRPGPLTTTGNVLDLAIRGDGYFAVETPEGERFTRAGHFALDADGQVVTTAGYPVLGDNGTPIVIPPESGQIVIADDGTISTDQGTVALLRLVRFENQQALKRQENGFYDAGPQIAEPAEDSDVQQGTLESSNVMGVVEMTKMMATVRSYQTAATLTNEEHERQRRAITALAPVRS